METTELNRRDLLRRGATVTALGGAALAFSGVGYAADDDHDDHDDRSRLADVARIHKLESDFHLARSTKDIGLMMSLWRSDASFDFRPAGVVARGTAEIRAFFLASPSFTEPTRMAFAPTFKGRIDLHGRHADIYFECHDVDVATGEMVTHLFLAGRVRRGREGWQFWRQIGDLAPLSVDTIYFP